ncbi:MAG: hypothetical protein Q8L51_03975 [Candidatus Amesbacteria bacterium]|nr:hypothetical protein [Candidatus Amesbacteria bacterium]
MRYSDILITKIRKLRHKGKTYGEINILLNIKLAKSTLHWICRNTPLPNTYLKKITKLNIKNLGIARATAAVVRKIKREELLKHLQSTNLPISLKINDKKTAKIALAMLCLGEASKSHRGSVFCLGNTDHRIIELFLKLLQICFDDFDINKIRCTVMCRADQDIESLEKYWLNVIKIPKTQFYKTTIDPRTIGKPTKQKEYKGVLRVDYFDFKTQLDLESLAQLTYNEVCSGPVV